ARSCIRTGEKRQPFRSGPGQDHDHLTLPQPCPPSGQPAAICAVHRLSPDAVSCQPVFAAGLRRSHPLAVEVRVLADLPPAPTLATHQGRHDGRATTVPVPKPATPAPSPATAP